MLRTHYRQPIDFTVKALEEAKAILDRWYEIVGDITWDDPPDLDFMGALCDDLNTPAALGHLHRLAVAESSVFRPFTPPTRPLKPLRASANLLGLLQTTRTEWLKCRGKPEADEFEILFLIDARNTARAAKLVLPMVGPSGVGKTSLLNAIQPGLGQRVGEISRATDKGKHTTTHLELFPLGDGGGLIDTPGMREFGLWDMPGAALAGVFREMQPLLGHCRFGAACCHLHEPGCAIKAAVESGMVRERRYQSYLRLRT